MTDISLPVEILEHVLSAVPPSSQITLHAATLVSRAWYSAAIQYLYRAPQVTTRNFELFVRSVCPSVNAHIRHNGLAELVRILDMSRLVHDASKSLTARLLSRVKGNLEVFVAPQSSFASNSLAAIAKCKRLHELDLTLVSQSIQLSDLLRSLQKLDQLKNLWLPKAWSPPYTGYETRYCKEWPPQVRDIHLNGAFYEINLTILRNIPKTTTHLWIDQRYEYQSASFLSNFLEAAGAQLLFLCLVQRPVREQRRSLLRVIHEHCRKLEHLIINVELFGGRGLASKNEGLLPTPTYSRLDLDYSGIPGFGRNLAWSLTQLVELIYDDALPYVRKVGIARNLGWTDSKDNASQIADMDEFLKTLAREDGTMARFQEAEAGVVLFG